MNWRSLAIVTVAAATVAGCDKIPVEKIPFIGKKLAPAEQPAEAPAGDSLATEQQGDSAVTEGQTEAQAPAAEQAQQPPAPQPSPARQQPTRPAPQVSIIGEEPWFPVDTGTVAPGMTEEQVVQLWGEPVTDRSFGAWTYMYFRNGCERRCGTFDVVFFENGQVVDAIVRGRGHYYSGVSSSPSDREAEFTPPVPSGTPIGDIG